MSVNPSSLVVLLVLFTAAVAHGQQVTLQVGSSSDDYKESSSGAVSQGATTHELFSSTYEQQAYRFVGCPVPQGWTVEEARLEVYASNATYADDPLDGYAVGQDVGNAPAYAGTNFEITNAAKTSATTAVTDLPAWTNNAFNLAADVTDIVQEIVDRGDYTSGNAVKIFLVANSTSSFRRIATYNDASAKAARLYIRYSTNELPVAHLIATPASGSPPLNVAFDADGSTDDDGTIEDYAFDFDDGATTSGTDPTVSHSYTTAGLYEPCLTVTDERGGQDVTCVKILVGSPVFSATLQVGTEEDDYKENWTGSSNKGDNTHDLFINGDLHQALRFTNSPIPAQAQIQSANLKLYATGSTYVSRSISGTVKGQASGDAPAWTGSQNEITAAAKTTASVSFSSLPTWTVNTHNLLANAGTVVQEIVNRSDYASGNALKLFLTGSTADFRRTATYDASPAEAAKLEVSWTLTPLTAAISGPSSTDANSNVNFSASGSSGPIVEYVWRFGHGIAPVTTTGASVSHRFGAYGTFEVSVTAVAADGRTATATTTIQTTGFGSSNYMVRPVYFVPTNRTPDADYEAKFQTAMKLIDQFYAENLQKRGYGYRPLNYEKDGNGDAVVHLLIGDHDDQYYLETGSYETGVSSQLIQTELEEVFDMEKDCLLVVSDVQWYDPTLLLDVGPWSGGRAFPGRGGIGFVGNPFRWIGTSVAQQITIFDDATMDMDIGPRPRGDNASILLGGMAHELAHAFGAQHTDVPADLMTGAAWAFRNYFVDPPYGGIPILARQTARVMDNSAMFRSDTTFGDNTDPTIQLHPPLVVEGSAFTVTPSVSDSGGSNPALFLAYFNGNAVDSIDLRGQGASFAFPYTMGDSLDLPEGTYPFGYIVYDGDSNRFESDAVFRVVDSIPSIPSPLTPGGSETVWAEDARPAGSLPMTPIPAWQSTIKTSGNLAMYQKSTATEQAYSAWYGAYDAPLTLTSSNSVVAYLYIVSGHSLDGIAVELGDINGGGIRLYWGNDSFDTNHWGMTSYRVGNIPSAGGWLKLTVPTSTAGITTTRTFVNGAVRASGTGVLVWDRIGKQ